MDTAYLLIGGNIGNREEYLQQARTLINELAGEVRKTSSIYETAAWGMTDQNAFLNQVLEIATPYNAHHLMDRLLLIEEKMGRKRSIKFGPRTIDIDILLFGNEVHNTSHTRIPHPELPNRRFALIPLAELAGDLEHPVLHKSINELLDACPDQLAVNKI
ncbi:2-amino-4-hydroxy-6-hydroxymethyldihydropteridine diphosphokinase [Flavihumibacter rivuli]|uniref:2-amino-4-hydroxy-6- hydroxymethyldihydropteridine diphosphokinase n=1 Tax=Flavihumibacter rivuli TaxID=2838156 RepID=UPI001BDE65EC|nr:2-amino-4-hydroxy-6-hydroxymethyldihydropteridine diphosphokinase [Flavihumibacter rivuli]ULQ57338.1 2-amino-4-hydroxy-6-hydroxymethyldihydropteridine diphosphokinase [Flavihumibacter rivuli]